MAQMIIAENPKRKRRKKRNPKTAAAIRGKSTKAVNPIRRRTTKAGALSFAKRNGLKLVKATSANPKRKRRTKRRNPSVITRRSNPAFFGKTSKDVKEVIALLAGLFGTKGLGRFLIPYLQPYMAQLNAAKYTEILIDGLIGLGLAPMVAKKFAPSLAQQVRLGGLAAVGLDGMELIAPDTFNMLNPFNQNPIVLTSGGQPAIKPQAVKDIVREVASGQTSVAKVEGAMDALSAGMPVIDYTNTNSTTMPIGGSDIF